MTSIRDLVWLLIILPVLATNTTAQENSLLQPAKLDWSAIGKSLKDELPQPKKAAPVNEKVEFERAKKAVDKFLKKRNLNVSKTEIDGIWRASQGIYYVFDRGRSAQILFLDMMSRQANKSAPIIMNSTFRLTSSSINFHPDTEDSRHVPFELIQAKNGELQLRMNLNGNKESTWKKIELD